MADNSMNTEPGGESTQYESIKTVTNPPDKQTGQLGNIAPPETTEASEAETERGERTAENIRYGQKISEEGMGGTTTDDTGEANVDGGYGASAETTGTTDGDADARAAQGYDNAQEGEKGNDVGG